MTYPTMRESMQAEGYRVIAILRGPDVCPTCEHVTEIYIWERQEPLPVDVQYWLTCAGCGRSEQIDRELAGVRA